MRARGASIGHPYITTGDSLVIHTACLLGDSVKYKIESYHFPMDPNQKLDIRFAGDRQVRKKHCKGVEEDGEGHIVRLRSGGWHLEHLLTEVNLQVENLAHLILAALFSFLIFFWDLSI